MIDRIEITATDDLTEIQRISDLVEHFGRSNRLPARTIFHVNLALDELLTNLIHYGYQAHNPLHHDIRIRLMLDDEGLTTEFRDNGCAFDPLQASPPDLDLAVEDKPIGGLGIHFVLSVMDEVRYRRQDGFNRLTMRQRLVRHSRTGQPAHNG